MNQEYEDQLLSLCQTLKSGTTDEKLKALKRLATFKDRRSLEFLLPLLSDSESKIRRLALHRLGSLETPKAYLAILPLLEDPVPMISFAAVSYLIKSGLPQVGQRLLDKLKNPSIEQTLRLNLASGVSQLLTPSLLSQVYEMCHHSSAEIRASAIMILCRTSFPQSWEAFRVALSDESEEVRLEALKALAYINPRDLDFALGLSLFPSEDFDEMAWLADLGPVVLPHLNEPNPELCLLAAQILFQIRHQPALPQLLALLTHDSDTVKANVASYLGDWASPEADSALLPLLQDPVSTVRIRAAVALHKLGNPIGITSLLSWFFNLKTDAEMQERLNMADVLYNLSFPDELTFWSERLSDPHKSIRNKALAKLSHFGQSESLNRVFDYLATLESHAIGDAIGYALSLDLRFIHALLNWLTNSEPKVHQDAFNGLLAIVHNLSDPDLARSVYQKLESYIEQALTHDTANDTLTMLLERRNLKYWRRKHLTQTFLDNLTDIYREGNTVPRRVAAHVLCQMRSGHESLYHEMLADEDEDIRHEAFELCLQRNKASFALFQENIQSWPASSTAWHSDVLACLYWQHVPGLEWELLLNALEHPVQSVRTEAITDLQSLSEKKQKRVTNLEKRVLTMAVEPLLEMLPREITRFRISIIETLGHIGDERAILPLENAMQYDLLSVGEAAKNALESIKQREGQGYESIQSNR